MPQVPSTFKDRQSRWGLATGQGLETHPHLGGLEGTCVSIWVLGHVGDGNTQRLCTSDSGGVLPFNGSAGALGLLLLGCS